jgi:hypothetical protein
LFSGYNVNNIGNIAMLIYVAMLEGVFDIGLASLMDVIGTATELIGIEQPSVHFDRSAQGAHRTGFNGAGASGRRFSRA